MNSIIQNLLLFYLIIKSSSTKAQIKTSKNNLIYTTKTEISKNNHLLYLNRT